MGKNLTALQAGAFGVAFASALRKGRDVWSISALELYGLEGCSGIRYGST